MRYTYDPYPVRSKRRNIPFLAGLFAMLMLVVLSIVRCNRQEPDAEPSEEKTEEAPLPADVFSPLAKMVYPTEHDLLVSTGMVSVFHPTSLENPASAFYGSTRTAASRRGPYASFHEAIDIGPARTDRRGRAVDEIHAVADGTVAYANRVGGNSSYGIYVVLVHDDPVGPVYTLYAHMASVAEGIRPGKKVSEGTPLGIMGHTSAFALPVSRTHLHFEIGLIVNARFEQWARKEKIKLSRGIYHGWNLTGVDPLAVYAVRMEKEHFSFSDYLQTVVPAFELILHVKRLPDFFQRYPKLWSGPPFQAGVLVLKISEGGLILAGRAATEDEKAAVPKQKDLAVRNVNEAVLGRNGIRLISRRGDSWVAGSAMERWLEILLQ